MTQVRKTFAQFAVLAMAVLAFALLLDQVIDLADEIPPILLASESTVSDPLPTIVPDVAQGAAVVAGPQAQATGPDQPDVLALDGTDTASLPVTAADPLQALAPDPLAVTAADPLPQVVPETAVVAALVPDPNDVRPTLTSIRDSWVAVRPFEGRDYVYFSGLLANRCGLQSVRYGLNGAPPKALLRMEPCHTGTRVPNSLNDLDRYPVYLLFDLNSVGQVAVEVTYADGTQDTAVYSRAQILLQ